MQIHTLTYIVCAVCLLVTSSFFVITLLTVLIWMQTTQMEMLKDGFRPHQTCDTKLDQIKDMHSSFEYLFQRLAEACISLQHYH